MHAKLTAPALSLALQLTVASASCNAFSGSSVFRDASWVKSHVDAGNATLLDTRGGNPTDVIAGAVKAHWTIFTQSATGTPTGGLLQDDATLRSALKDLGVTPEKTVVVYGSWESAWGEEGRIHWVLKYLGHPDAYILAGGLQAYNDLYPDDITNASSSAHPAATWDAAAYPVVPEIRATKDQLLSGSLFLVDTRAADEYDGSTEKPYGVSQDGHVNGSISYPYIALFQGSCLRGCQDIENDLTSLGWDGEEKLIAYCTAGIRSGMFWSVMTHCTADQLASANYDGSMWEYTADSSSVMCDSSERFCFSTPAPAPALENEVAGAKTFAGAGTMMLVGLMSAAAALLC